MSANPTDADLFLDPRIDQGLQLFNAHQFYACHDVLEDFWSDMPESGKPMFQGLIQAAVALFHFEEGNLGGSIRMYTSCRRYLAPYVPLAARIEVGKLLEDLSVCFAELCQFAESCQPDKAYPADVRLQRELIPTIIRRPA